MTNKITTTIWLACLATASAGEPAATPPVSTETKLPNVDVSLGFFTHSDDMDFDDLDGSLSITEFDFISVLSRPVTVAGDIMLVPLVQYGWTGLILTALTPHFPSVMRIFIPCRCISRR